MSFLDFLSGGLTAGTTAAAAGQNANAQANERQKQDQLTLMALLRQKQMDQSELALHGAQTNADNARADYYRTVPMGYGLDGDGNIITEQKRGTPGAAPPITQTGVPGYVKPTVTPIDGSDGNPRKKSLVTVRPGGTTAPIIGPNGQPATRTTPPPAGGAGSASDMPTVHAATSVRNQMNDVNRQMVAAQKAAAVTGDQVQSGLLQPDELARQQALAAQLPALTAKHDSLSAVYSKLAQRQQTTATGAPVTVPSGAARMTNTVRTSRSPGGTAAAATIAKDLQDVLMSAAPDSVKIQARKHAHDALKMLQGGGATPPEE